MQRFSDARNFDDQDRREQALTSLRSVTLTDISDSSHMEAGTALRELKELGFAKLSESVEMIPDLLRVASVFQSLPDSSNYESLISEDPIGELINRLSLLDNLSKERKAFLQSTDLAPIHAGYLKDIPCLIVELVCEVASNFKEETQFKLADLLLDDSLGVRDLCSHSLDLIGSPPSFIAAHLLDSIEMSVSRIKSGFDYSSPPQTPPQKKEQDAISSIVETIAMLESYTDPEQHLKRICSLFVYLPDHNTKQIKRFLSMLLEMPGGIDGIKFQRSAVDFVQELRSRNLSSATFILKELYSFLTVPDSRAQHALELLEGISKNFSGLENRFFLKNCLALSNQKNLEIFLSHVRINVNLSHLIYLRAPQKHLIFSILSHDPL